MDSDWIDVSVPVRTGMVHWPGNPAVVVERFLDMERGDPANVSRISMGSHTGTHMDAPVHFVERGAGIDGLPMSVVIGRARVIEIKDAEAVRPEELAAHGIRRGERILFKTANSGRAWRADSFVEDFVYLSPEGARYLAGRSIRLAGIDYLSMGGFKGGETTHRVLLEAGVWIVEGLDLSQVEPGGYEIICLPLKIMGADGAPARVVLKPARGRAGRKG